MGYPASNRLQLTKNSRSSKREREQSLGYITANIKFLVLLIEKCPSKSFEMTVGINQKIAPIRFCFLIVPHNEERLIRAMEVAFSIWGGINSPILPYYPDLPDDYRLRHNIEVETMDFYRNAIENYDPDVILVDEDIDIASVQPLVGERQVDRIVLYLDKIIHQHNHAISINEISQHFLFQEFKYNRSDGIKFAIPKVAEDVNKLLLCAFVGCLPQQLRDEVKDLFSGVNVLEEPNLNWDNMSEFQLTGNVDLITLNTFRLKSWAEKSFLRGSALFIMRSSDLNDIIGYWNLRAAGWQIIPVPIDISDYTYFKSVVKKFVDWSSQQTQGLIASVKLLIGNGCNREQVDATLEQILPDLTTYTKQIFVGHQHWFPRFWEEITVVEADQVRSHMPVHDTAFDHHESDGEIVRFTPKGLNFKVDRDSARDHTYKIVLSLSFYDEYMEYAEAIWGITTLQLRQLISVLDFRKWRLSSLGIHRFIRDEEDEIRFYIPKSSNFFSTFFSNKSHKLRETVNSKLAKEVLKNMGGLQSVSFFLRYSHLKIIEQFEGGKEIVYSALLADIKRLSGKNKNTYSRHFIHRLLEYKIVEMGATIKCKICEQHGFFLPQQIAQSVVCPICRNQYQLPMDDPSEIVWAYRGIGPFSRNNKADGVWAVFATMQLFKREFAEFDSKISVLAGFELMKHGSPSDANVKEVDLAILLQDSRTEINDLVFCECKTYKTFTEKDMERMRMLGDEFPGAILTFATLNENLNNDEKRLLADTVKYFQRGSLRRPQNPVLILTGKELLPEKFDGALAEYETQIKPYHKYNDFVGSLAELSIKKHLIIQNWWDIQDQKWNEEIQRRQLIANIVKALEDRF